MTDWNEDKYKLTDKQKLWAEEQKRCNEHNCYNNASECDIVHPNIAKNLMAILPQNKLRHQPHPKNWRAWLQNPKVLVHYMNQHNLRMEVFNMTEAFNQMSTSAKLNIFNNMFLHLLDDDEKSLFMSDLLENYDSQSR